MIANTLPIASILISLLILAVFILPGYGWVTWLHRADQISWPTRLALGFAWSFALFSLVGGPFLWFRGSFANFLVVFSLVWALFTLAGGLAFWSCQLGSGRVTEPKSLPPATERVLDPTRDGVTKVSFQAWGFLFLYFCFVAAVVSVWTFGKPTQRALLIMNLPALLLLGGWLAWRIRNTFGPQLRFTAADDAPPPRLWMTVAILLIVLQAGSAVLYYRPDWDDCFYLAMVLDYQQASVLNEQDPTARESGVGIGAVHRAMCWELWGATLCYFSGLTPLVLFHSLLPGFLVLAVYAAYAALLAEFLPRRWVPLALIGLWGYHLWGISSLANASNHFLVRVWQGKAVMLHFAVPLTVVLLIRYAGRPDWRRWLSLSACVCCGLGASSSAIFIEGALISCLSLALLPTLTVGRLRFLVGAALSLTPLAVEALGILTVTPDHLALPQTLDDPASNWSTWFMEFNVQAGQGSAELIWVVSLPLLSILLVDWKRQSYLVACSALLLMTVANPFLADLVRSKITSPSGYYRIFWLFPVGTGLATLLALLARLTAWIPAHRFLARPLHLPLMVCGLGLLLCSLLPGKYVWSPENNLGPFMTPGLAENLEKMPPDLLAIAASLASDPECDEGYILCGEEVASFLVPYSRRFRFVVTRPMYTVNRLVASGRPNEAMERYFLVMASDRGKLVQDWVQSPTLQDVPGLLDRYHVLFVVTSPALWAPNDQLKERVLQEREQLLQDNGYQIVYQGKEYILWKRKIERGLEPITK